MPKFMNLLPSLKPYVIDKAEDGKTAKVNLYGEIVDEVPTDWWTGEKVAGLFIELKSFLNDVEDLSDMDEVFFYINSVGGSVDAGVSIFNKIRAMKAETTTIVDGLAASAASIVAQAGDHRQETTDRYPWAPRQWSTAHQQGSLGITTRQSFLK